MARHKIRDRIRVNFRVNSAPESVFFLKFMPKQHYTANPIPEKIPS